MSTLFLKKSTGEIFCANHMSRGAVELSEQDLDAFLKIWQGTMIDLGLEEEYQDIWNDQITCQHEDCSY